MKAAITTGQEHSSDLQIGFVFTGQGAQWHAMGRELYGQHGYAVYTSALDRADRYLRRLGAHWSLVDELTLRDAKDSQVSEAHISQPACTVVQLCLVDLLRSWGIRPAAVTGHSSGEIAAAYAAGFITFEAAVAVAYHRGRMIPVLKASFTRIDGSMMAVGGSKEDIQPLIDSVNSKLEGTGEQIRIACYNSPTSLTISGDGAGITLLEEIIRENQPDTFNRRLQVDVAYHSHHMNFVAKEYMEALLPLPQPRSLHTVKFYSSLFGRKIEGSECNANYWVDNLTRPVRFSEALDCMVKTPEGETPVNLLVELGPHSALQGPIKQILQAAGVAKSVAYTSALVRKRTAVETALELASTVISKGGVVRMDRINSPSGCTNDKVSLLTDLPRYAWNHQSRYWHDSRLSRKHTHRGAKRRELIGVESIYSTNLEPTWRNVFTLDDLPWLRHHQIQGLTVFPLAGFVAMAVEASAQRVGKNIAKNSAAALNTVELKDVEVTKPLAFPSNVVDGNGSLELSISLRRRHDPLLDEEWDEFRISSWSSNSEWTEHCAGLVMMKSADTLKTASRQSLITGTTKATQDAAAVELQAADVTAMYETLSEMGVGYGPSFQGIQDCRVANGFAVGAVSGTRDDESAPSTTFLHATALEAIIEMYWPILRSNSTQTTQDIVYLPSSIRHMSISANSAAALGASGLRTHCVADFSGAEARPTSVNVLATARSDTSDAAEILVSVDGLTVSPILEGGALESGEDDGLPRHICYKYDWDEVEADDAIDSTLPDAALQDADVVILHGDTSSPSYLLASQLAITLESATSRLPALEGGIFEDATAETAETVKSLTSGKTCIVLTEMDESFLAEATDHQFNTLKALAGAADRILWLTSGGYLNSNTPGSNMISGLSRTIRSETTMPFVHLDFEAVSGVKSDPEATSNVILDVLRRALGGSGVRDMEFVYRSGKLLVPRVVSDSHMDQIVKRDTDPSAMELQPFSLATVGGRALRMQFMTTKNTSKAEGGDSFHGVHFVEDFEAADVPLADDEIEFEVRAVGVNKHDALLACDPASSATAGLEASGIVTRVGSGITHAGLRVGSRIACLTTALKKRSPGAFATLARTTAATVLQMPSEGSTESLSFEQAAALPLAYCTAYYSLLDQARLESGQRVLVTSPSEPAGQAAICLASIVGAEVFVVGRSSEEESAILSRHQDSIAQDHIIITRGAPGRETYDAVMRATNGSGVDVVINSALSSVKGSHLQQLWTACLAPFGCLVQVQEPTLRGDQHENRGSHHKLHEVRPSSLFDNVTASGNTSCLTVDMLALATARPQVLDRVFAKVADLFDQGKIHSVSGVNVLPFSRTHEAFLKSHDPEAASKKFVLQYDVDDQIMAPPAKISENILRADATYLIVGGTGGLGRSMARWMIQHGAAHVVLLSRSGSATPAVQALIDEAAATGAKVHVRACDVADETSVSALLAGVADLPPVRGVVHSAMVLRDVLFEKMTHAEYRAVIESKVQGAWNLHRALDGSAAAAAAASSSAPLDFFVAISSVSAVVGNRGQAAYAAANTYLDGLVQHRVAKGLPAVSLALAAVSDAGYLADAEGGADRAADVLRNLGGDSDNTICEVEVLALLHAAVTGETSSCGHHVITGVSMGEDRSRASKDAPKRSLPFWSEDAKFAHLVEAAKANDGDAEEDGKGAAMVLNPSLTQDEAEALVSSGLVAKIAEVLMMEQDELDVTRSLSHYPLDSLVAIEIRNFIARQYEASMQVLELLSSGSIQTLSSTVCRKSKLCQF